MKKVHWCDRTLIRNPYCFVVCTSAKQYARLIKKLDGINWLDFPIDCATTNFADDGKHGLIAIVCVDQKSRKLVEIIGLLVHEAVHIKRAIMEEIGEREPSAEFECYSVQWITQQLIESWAKHDKRGNGLMK